MRDFGPVPFLVRLPCEILRKYSSTNSNANENKTYDSMQNRCNCNFITFPLNISSEFNNNNATKEPYYEETTENELKKNLLDAIDFNNLSMKEDENASEGEDKNQNIDYQFRF